MKLHLCAGHVYLTGYINVDIYQGGYTHVATERRDLLAINETTLDKYYKYEMGTHPTKLCVVDVYCDVRKLSDRFSPNKMDEVLMFSAFEHFSKDEAYKILCDVMYILKPGGTFHFNVPDLLLMCKNIAGFEELTNMSDEDRADSQEWQIRLIYGSGKDPFAYHKWGYTHATLIKIIQAACEEAGCAYSIVWEDLVPTDYPMIGVSILKETI